MPVEGPGPKLIFFFNKDKYKIEEGKSNITKALELMSLN